MNAISTNPAMASQPPVRSAIATHASRGQVWNIFRKDLLHHWREIAASVALLAGFVWIEVREWTRHGFAANFFITDLLMQLIVPLVPISWIFLIVRAVQGESLVGDRQFWVTRPYEWPKLAASKALLVLAFVNLPLFLADLLLLALAGFPPFRSIEGLLWLQGAWLLILVLPTAALASVTAGIGQMVLAMLFVALYQIAFAALLSVIPNSTFIGSLMGIFLWLTLLTACAVLLLQYSRRKTTQSRWLIAGLGAVIALIVVVTPYRTLIARSYPLATGNELPLQLSLLPSHAPAPDRAVVGSDYIPFDLSFNLAGLPQGSFVEFEGDMLTLVSTDGNHWDSHWSGGGMLLFPEQKSTKLTFFMKKKDFDRMKSSPVTARLMMAFTLFRDSDQRPFVVPPREFAFEHFGVCESVSAFGGNLQCRAPLHGPAWLLVTGVAASSTCPAPPTLSSNAGGIGHQFLRSGSPAEFGITPVRDFQISLSAWTNARSQRLQRHLRRNPADAQHSAATTEPPARNAVRKSFPR